MNKELTTSKSIIISSTPEKVWDVLTNPAKVKKYLFGTHVKTDWNVGSPIVFQGEYDGKKYEDKGNVVENRPYETLKYNYWSGFSGLEDKPENHSLVSYTIEKLTDHEIKLTWHQRGFPSEAGRKHTEQALEGILETIKRIAEE